MKRAIAIIIVVLFLLQAFAGLQFVNKRTVEEDSTVEQVPTGAHALERDPGTRNGGGQINHTEEDDMGGSWFDGFDDLDESEIHLACRGVTRQVRRGGVEGECECGGRGDKKEFKGNDHGEGTNRYFN